MRGRTPISDRPPTSRTFRNDSTLSKSEWEQTPVRSDARGETPQRHYGVDSSSTRRGTGSWTSSSKRPFSPSNKNSWEKETPLIDKDLEDGRVGTEAWESEQTKIDRDWYNLEDNTVCVVFD